MSGRAVAGTRNCLARIRFRITPTATCMTGLPAQANWFFNSTLEDEEDHPNLVDADKAPPGHGVLLWFQVSDFDAAVVRARALGAEAVLEPHFNPAPQHREIWLRDADGYVVVIASPDGERSA